MFFRRVLLPVKNCYVHTLLPVKMEAAEPTTRLTANLTSVRVRTTVALQKQGLHGGQISLFALGPWCSLCSNVSRPLF